MGCMQSKPSETEDTTIRLITNQADAKAQQEAAENTPGSAQKESESSKKEDKIRPSPVTVTKLYDTSEQNKIVASPDDH